MGYLSLSAMWGHSEKVAISNQQTEPTADLSHTWMLNYEKLLVFKFSSLRCLVIGETAALPRRNLGDSHQNLVMRSSLITEWAQPTGPWCDRLAEECRLWDSAVGNEFSGSESMGHQRDPLRNTRGSKTPVEEWRGMNPSQ